VHIIHYQAKIRRYSKQLNAKAILSNMYRVR